MLSLLAALGGGMAVDHYLIPRGGTAVNHEAGESPGHSLAPVSTAKGSAPAAALTGGVAGLLRIAREAGDYNHAGARLLIALDHTEAEELRRLTGSFPWKAQMTWQENAVYSTLLSCWADRDADGVLKWCASLPENRFQNTRSIVLSALARRDPDKALAHARAIKNAGQRRGALSSLIHVIAATDPRRALAVFQSLGSNMDSYQLQNIFSTWAANDPAEAFAAAAGLRKPNDRSRALTNALQSWAAADPAAAHAAALGLPEGQARSQGLQSVLAAWAGEDPRSAYAAASALTEGRDRTQALQSVFSAWAYADPQAAHAAASALPEGRSRTQAISNVIQAWASKDPGGALAATLALPKGQSRRNGMMNVFAAWAADDPQGAAAAAAGGSLSLNDRAQVSGQIAQAWAQSDPNAALAWARTLPAREGGDNAVGSALQQIAATDGPAAAAAWQELSPRQRKNQLGNVVNSWAWQDRDAATQWARSLENPQDRSLAISGCLNGLEFAETDKITALLKELPEGPARINAIRGVVGNHSGDDPEGTLTWLLTLTENERSAALKDGNTWELANGDPRQMAALLRATPALGAQNYLWGSVAGQLAAEDPVAALEWVESLDSPAARKQSTDQVMRMWAYEDAPGALAKAQTITDPAQQKSAMRAVLETWASSDPDAVLAWAATASGEQREVALLHGSLQKADNDPAASAGIVSQLLAQSTGAETPSHLASAAGNVARAWFQQDVTGAAQWAAQLPAGEAQESAVNTIAEAWTGLDPLAASAWVQQLPQGDSRDAAVRTLANGIVQSDPESAFTWAVTIGDPAKRDDVVRSAAQAWRWQDRDAALAAVQQAPISDTVRTSLLEEMAKQE